MICKLIHIAVAGLSAAAFNAVLPGQVRPTPPIRSPDTPGYVSAAQLPDGANAPGNADGNFILGPTHHTSTS